MLGKLESRESVLGKTAGVGVGFSKMLESESIFKTAGVGVDF